MHTHTHTHTHTQVIEVQQSHQDLLESAAASHIAGMSFKHALTHLLRVIGLVEGVLGFIAASKSGLSREELEDVVSLKEDLINNSMFALYRIAYYGVVWSSTL